jgi:hypothetical protein
VSRFNVVNPRRRSTTAIIINALISKHNDNNPDDYDTSLYVETEESINQGESLTTRPETTTTKKKLPTGRSPDQPPTIIILRRIKISTTLTSSLTLPESHKLKGAKN